MRTNDLLGWGGFASVMSASIVGWAAHAWAPAVVVTALGLGATALLVSVSARTSRDLAPPGEAMITDPPDVAQSPDQQGPDA